jgi:hypothetical protein
MTAPAAVNTAIKTYRIRTIVILCCCVVLGVWALITGIPALIYSYRVSKSLAVGDFAAAARASRRTRMLNWISAGLILLPFVAAFAFAYAVDRYSIVKIPGGHTIYRP